MAFPNFHVTLHAAPNTDRAQILGAPVATESMSAGGTTNLIVPIEPPSEGRRYVARIHTSVDAWVTVGCPPADPSLPASARLRVDANTPVEIFIDPDCRVAWCVA